MRRRPDRRRPARCARIERLERRLRRRGHAAEARPRAGCLDGRDAPPPLERGRGRARPASMIGTSSASAGARCPPSSVTMRAERRPRVVRRTAARKNTTPMQNSAKVRRIRGSLDQPQPSSGAGRVARGRFRQRTTSTPLRQPQTTNVHDGPCHRPMRREDDQHDDGGPEPPARAAAQRPADELDEPPAERRVPALPELAHVAAEERLLEVPAAARRRAGATRPGRCRCSRRSRRTPAPRTRRWRARAPST